ncbi:MAG TPA: RcnB family protein [Gallionella sp.]|nr:RcnB family protein [Gallionella sp.]
MNRKAIVSTMMAISLIMSGFAFADGNDQHDRGGDRHGDRHDRGGDWHDRGAGPHGYHNGDRLTRSERSRRHSVNNWHEHNLRAPPRGYRWVRSGNDFVLVAITTGIIADILLNH